MDRESEVVKANRGVRRNRVAGGILPTDNRGV